MVCFIMCCLVKLIIVLGLLILIFLSMVKFVEMLFSVWFVNIEIYGKFLLDKWFNVVLVFDICINDIRDFCIWVFLFVEK